MYLGLPSIFMLHFLQALVFGSILFGPLHLEKQKNGAHANRNSKYIFYAVWLYFNFFMFLIIFFCSGWKEFMCTIIAAFLGMPGGVLLFIPLYHPLHDIYNIHSEITCFLLFAIYASLIWLSLSKCLDETRDYMNKTTNRIIFLYMTVYYFFFIGKFYTSLSVSLIFLKIYLPFFVIGIASFIDPSSEVSIGWHEPIGPCNVTTSIQTASGHTLYKRKYLCTTDNDETYFGWSCLPNGESPADGASWYTICGTSYTNKIEYILILTAAAIVGLSFFFKTLFSNVYNNEEITYEHKLLVKENKKLKTK